jgi:acyl-CoA reductase-like NAD-dependent aldehyde dehydrogenase
LVLLRPLSYAFLFGISTLQGLCMASAKTYGNLIGGKFVPARSGKTFENRNPADTSDLVGIFAASDAADVDAAVEAAAKAYQTWRLTPAPKRAEILYRTGELLLKRKEEFARDMTRDPR